jgi:hypothetical protein
MWSSMWPAIADESGLVLVVSWATSETGANARRPARRARA